MPRRAKLGDRREAEDAGCWPQRPSWLPRRHRRRGRHVQCRASDPGRTGAAGEHREGGTGEALGHGLPARDPDLSGAIGRLAVRRDQPGPRDLHQAARGRRQGRLRRRALSGGRRPGAAAVRHGPGLPRPGDRRQGQRRPSAQPEPAQLGYDADAIDPSTFHLADGGSAREAPARQGLRRDRSA